MITRYPHIMIGVMVLLVPFVFMIGTMGAAVILTSSIDFDKVEYSYGYLNNATETILMIYPSYTWVANEPNSLVDIGRLYDGCESHTASHSIFASKSGGVSDVGGSIGRIGSEYFTVVSDYYLEHDTASINIQDFDKVILMRNSYVTDNFRNMVLNHDNVVYMFPDVFTHEVTTNSTYTKAPSASNINMTYVGEYEPLHPDAINWADDNRCNEWKFVKVINGYMMNCVPDVAIINNHDMLIAMRDISTRSDALSKPNIDLAMKLWVAECDKHIYDNPLTNLMMEDAEPRKSTWCLIKDDIIESTDINNGWDIK